MARFLLTMLINSEMLRYVSRSLQPPVQDPAQHGSWNEQWNPQPDQNPEQWNQQNHANFDGPQWGGGPVPPPWAQGMHNSQFMSGQAVCMPQDAMNAPPSKLSRYPMFRPGRQDGACTVQCSVMAQACLRASCCPPGFAKAWRKLNKTNKRR